MRYENQISWAWALIAVVIATLVSFALAGRKELAERASEAPPPNRGASWSLGMVSAHAIYAAIIALGTCFAERNDPRVPDHLERIAVAVSLEARDIDEAAALLAIARSESAFSVRVQEAPTQSGAISDFQIEARPGRFAGPLVGLELEPIQNATRAAAWYWRHSFTCGHTIRDRFSAYHGAAFCGHDWSTLDTRVLRFAHARAVMWREARAT